MFALSITHTCILSITHVVLCGTNVLFCNIVVLEKHHYRPAIISFYCVPVYSTIIKAYLTWLNSSQVRVWGLWKGHVKALSGSPAPCCFLLHQWTAKLPKQIHRFLHLIPLYTYSTDKSFLQITSVLNVMLQSRCWPSFIIYVVLGLVWPRMVCYLFFTFGCLTALSTHAKNAWGNMNMVFFYASHTILT